ncbi:MAG: phage tail protein [Planktomarina sp.]
MNLGLVMMALGPFRFGLSNPAFQEFKKSAQYIWEEVDRIGHEPALHFAGPRPQKVTITGEIYPQFRGGLHQTELMHLQAKNAVPLALTDGFGWFWRQWVIVGVDDSRTYFLPNGKPRKIDFSLQLKSYVAGPL